MTPYGFLSKAKALRHCGGRRQPYRRQTLDWFASDQKQKETRPGDNKIHIFGTRRTNVTGLNARELRARNWNCQNLSKAAISASTSRHPVDARNNWVLVPMYRRIPPSLTPIDILALCRATGEGNQGLKGAHTPARAASSLLPTLMPYRFFVVPGGAKGESIFMRGTSFQTWNQNK